MTHSSARGDERTVAEVDRGVVAQEQRRSEAADQGYSLQSQRSHDITADTEAPLLHELNTDD